MEYIEAGFRGQELSCYALNGVPPTPVPERADIWFMIVSAHHISFNLPSKRLYDAPARTPTPAALHVATIEAN